MELKWLFFVLVLLVHGVIACTVPIGAMVINNSVDFCGKVYNLSETIIVSGSNFVINCQGAVLNGKFGIVAFSINRASNVTLKNCSILNYDSAFLVRNATGMLLAENQLIHNRVGARLFDVKKSALVNFDVSLSAPYEVWDSTENVIALSNRPVRGFFCSQNYCNQKGSAVVLFMKPQASLVELQNWIAKGIGGKTAARLHTWVFSDLGAR